jgi:hypothetical protein
MQLKTLQNRCSTYQGNINQKARVEASPHQKTNITTVVAGSPSDR